MTVTTPPSHTTLPSGDRMPSLGLGCWLAPEDALADAVAHAIKVGYRHIDGATVYRNEKAMGEGIKRSGVDRKDLWITTKLWNTDHKPDDVIKACKTSLDLLGLDYLDLWLMHYPCANAPGGTMGTYEVIDVPFTETWKAMEKCVDMGLVKNIGISNFSKIELDTLLKSCRIKPAVHQLERHPYLPQNAFMKYHKVIGLHVSAYTPLGNTNPSLKGKEDLPPILQNETVMKLADKYGISPANVLLSLQLSQGNSVLSKSLTPSRIEENLRVVQLSESDVEEIAKATEGQRKRFCDFGHIVKYKYYVGLDDND